MGGNREHWESIFRARAPAEVSWYRPHLERSLRFIDDAGLSKRAAIIDVGGGASTLVDDLLARGYERLTVLDLSPTAIAQAQARLGAAARSVTWLVGDVTRVALPRRHFDFWHDRAVFHFLVEGSARRRYVAAARRALKPDGHILIALFGPSGPERCSGLPVVRYDAEGIRDQLGTGFRMVGADEEVHRTPSGAEQAFVYCLCRRRA